MPVEMKWGWRACVERAKPGLRRQCMGSGQGRHFNPKLNHERV